MTETIYTVSQLNREARDCLESHMASLWISGEISNFTCPSSGHWYFTLKDAMTTVRCAFFKPKVRGIHFRPENGMQVLLRARVSLYEARGEFQLIGESIEAVGDGLLQKIFNQRKMQLQAEGLFSAEHKKTLPAFPRTVGVVTSATGAAIKDIVSVLRRRFPLLSVIVYPCAVQGQLAAGEIVSAIQAANVTKACDVLIIGRGGGSLEDLWPFNEENVARAIFASEIPTISAVGHEIDFTIADFVADLRAPTPSAAAELVSPDQTDLLLQLQRLQQRFAHKIKQVLVQKDQQLAYLCRCLRHPRQRLQDQMQQLDQLEGRLFRAVAFFLGQCQQKLQQLSACLPDAKRQLQEKFGRLEQQQQQLLRAVDVHLQQKKQQFLTLSRALQAVSPLATLDRGYSLLMERKTNQLIRSVQHLEVGTKIIARLQDGQCVCVVEKTEPIL